MSVCVSVTKNFLNIWSGQGEITTINTDDLQSEAGGLVPLQLAHIGSLFMVSNPIPTLYMTPTPLTTAKLRSCLKLGYLGQ